MYGVKNKKHLEWDKQKKIDDPGYRVIRRTRLRMKKVLGRGFTWLDTGTNDSLLEASNFIQTIEKRQGLKVSCIEEIAYRMNFIDKAQLKKIVEPFLKTSYGNYINRLL